MSQEAYFSQTEKNIESLISEGKYREAHNLCLKYLARFPDEKRFKKLKGKIEEEVKIRNEKVVKEKLTKTKPLWKTKKYGEILKILEPLLKIAPNHETLKRNIIKAQEKYKKETLRRQEQFEKEQIARLTKILNEDENQLIDELFLMERGNPGNKEILKLTSLFRDKMIQIKIKKKTDLIYSDKYDAIYNFIGQLKRIDGKNKRVLDLEKLMKTRQHGTQLAEKSEFIYDAENHLTTLIRMKKYKKAIKVASEIMDLDPSNKKVQKILEKARKKYFKQTQKKSIDSIYENLDQLKEDYGKEKSKFIKI